MVEVALNLSSPELMKEKFQMARFENTGMGLQTAHQNEATIPGQERKKVHMWVGRAAWLMVDVLEAWS